MYLWKDVGKSHSWLGQKWVSGTLVLSTLSYYCNCNFLPFSISSHIKIQKRTIIKRDLEEGETLQISNGCLLTFTKHIDYDVQMMQGFKNVVFGGEGLFITTLKGPGRVWLQGMPPDRMISEIARRVPSGGIGLGIPMPIT